MVGCVLLRLMHNIQIIILPEALESITNDPRDIFPSRLISLEKGFKLELQVMGRVSTYSGAVGLKKKELSLAIVYDSYLIRVLQ